MAIKIFFVVVIHNITKKQKVGFKYTVVYYLQKTKMITEPKLSNSKMDFNKTYSLNYKGNGLKYLKFDYQKLSRKNFN